MNIKNMATLGFVSLLMLFIVSCSNGTRTADKSQIEKMVHDYIIKNPEVLIQSLQGYQQKQIDEAQKSIQKTQQVASKFATPLFHGTSDPIAGNPSGSIILVEFFDYQCPHCSQAVPQLQTLIKNNPDLKVIFKDFPIRGKMSEQAARASLAAQKQGKYLQFHEALLKSTATLNEDVIFKTAAKVGLNIDQLKKDMKSSDVNKKLDENMKLGQELFLFGTPSFFFAKSDVKNNVPTDKVVFVPGLVELNQMQNVIKKTSGAELNVPKKTVV